MRKRVISVGIVSLMALAGCGQKEIQGNVFDLCQKAVANWNKGNAATSDDVQACEQASAKGSVEAQLSLGYSYMKGIGVKKDESRGVKWFQAAAETGNTDAQYNLGLAYVKGLGVTKDFKLASEWFLGAAVEGDSGAQYALGVMFAIGEGVNKDPVQSYAWFDLAASNGYADAKRSRDEVLKIMTPDQIVQAKERSATFRKRIEDKKKSASSPSSAGATIDLRNQQR